MKLSKTTLALITAAGLAFSGTAYAQQDHEQHHPNGGAAEATQGKQMPMKKGMKPSEMPKGNIMGKGMMMDGKMGPGMMGMGMMKGGMMRGGMMGRMGRGGMMGRNCPMMGMMLGSEDGETHAAGRIAFIRAELGITDSQKAVFDAYAEALKKNLGNMLAMRSSMMAGVTSSTPVEHLTARIQMMEGRLDSLKGMKPALENLYASLSDEQKKKAGRILTGMGCMM